MTEDRILILGGGFIGQALAKRIVQNNVSVSVLSRSTPANILNCINWQQGNLKNTNVLKDISTYRAVIYAACTSTPGQHVHTPSLEVEENLLPLALLLEVMQDHKEIPLIFLSSGGSIYGDPATLPVPEAHLLAPKSNHAAGKAAAEHFLGVFGHQGGSVVILRPSNIYGPEQPLKSGFGIIRTVLEHINEGTPITIWGDGETVRDYLYIDDLVGACISVLDDPITGTFNIGSGQGISLNSICSLAEKITGKVLNKQYQATRGVDVTKIVLNNTAMSSNYNWQPQVTIEDGIRLTWEWLQDHS
jgi:UDP-glucose 4-epimerase